MNESDEIHDEKVRPHELNEQQEHEIKIFDTPYHNTSIRILEFDHHDSEQAGVEYKLPSNWQELIKKELDQTKGPIAPEYCMPDIEKYLFSRNGPMGALSRSMLDERTAKNLQTDEGAEGKNSNPDTQIAPFYGFISKMAGVMQRNLLATDTANKAVYYLFSGASIAKHQSNENTRQLTGMGDEFKYEYGKIDPSEYKRHDSNDGRHLVSARGLMQEALRSNEEQITAMWAPKHAERIADYIQRQVAEEGSQNDLVAEPVDFRQISPHEEHRKMKIYGRPPLMRSVREYVPTLSSSAYIIDLLVNDEFSDPEQCRDLIKEYLNQEPKSTTEKRYQNKLRLTLLLLGKLGSKLSVKDTFVKRLINTDKFGWSQNKKEHIY